MKAPTAEPSTQKLVLGKRSSQTASFHTSTFIHVKSETVKLEATVMSRKKVKIEVESLEGSRITVAVEGPISGRKIQQLIELLDIVNSNGNGEHITPDADARSHISSMTLMEQLMAMLRKQFAGAPFNSKDVMSAFQETYHSKAGLSTISTYLGRLYRDGYLEREGNRASLRYHLSGKAKISRLQANE